MEKIFDLKFSVPPTLFLGLIFIAQPGWFIKISSFLSAVENDAILTGLFRLTGLLTLGFIISSIVDRIVRMKKMTATYGEEEERLLKRYFGCDNSCDNRYRSFNDKTDENLVNCELASWMVAEKTSDYVKSQIDKRWSMAITNFNCALASAFSFLMLFVVLFFNKFYHPLSFWFSLGSSMVLMLLFWFNGRKGLKSVRIADRMLVHNLCHSNSVSQIENKNL